MKMPGEKFRELQEYWYKVLEESGFEDIEKLVNGELVLKQTAGHSFLDVDALEYEIKGDYFTLLSRKVNDETTTFYREIDRQILSMYAEGAKIQQIVHHLSKTGIPFLRHKTRRNRNTIRFLIRRYETVWNIRKYTPKQLNEYRKCS